MKTLRICCVLLGVIAVAILAAAYFLPGIARHSPDDALISSFNKFVESQKEDEDTFVYLITGREGNDYKIYEKSSEKHQETNSIVVSRKELVFQAGIVRAVGNKMPDRKLFFANKGQWYNQNQLDDLRRDLVTESMAISSRIKK